MCIFGVMGRTIPFQSSPQKQLGTEFVRHHLKSLGLTWSGLKKKFLDDPLSVGWLFSQGFLLKIDCHRGSSVFQRSVSFALRIKSLTSTSSLVVPLVQVSGLTSQEIFGRLLRLQCSMSHIFCLSAMLHDLQGCRLWLSYWCK